MMNLRYIFLSLFRVTPLRLDFKHTRLTFTSNNQVITKEFNCMSKVDKWLYSQEAKNILQDPQWSWSGEMVLRDPSTNQYRHFQGAKGSRWKRTA